MKTNLISILTLAALSAGVLAQENPVDPEPNDPPPAPARPPGLDLPNPNDIQTPAGVNWELANADGNDIAILYNQLTGKRVLVSSAAASAELSMIIPGPLTKGEAARLLEKKLLMEGFSLEESGPLEVKLVLQGGGASNTKIENQRVISDISELPANSDEYVTWVMKLENLKPEEAVRTFGQVVGQAGAAGSMAPLPHASAVVISGNSPALRKIDKLRQEIDVPSATVGRRFVPVVYADVEELAAQLNEIFNQQTSQSSTSRVQRAQQQQAQGAAAQIPGLVAPDQAGGGAGEETPINIIPDARTNRILLIGRPVDLAFVESMIHEFDIKSSDRNFLRRKLKYLPVYEFMPVAQNAIERTLSGSGSSGGGGSLGLNRNNNTRNNTTNLNSRNTQNTNNRSSNFGGSSGGVGGGARAGVSGQEGTTAPDSIVIGKTLLVTDNITNSIVVQGPPHHIEIVDRLLDELDVPSQQVAITAVFGSYDLNDSTSFGLDIAGLALGSDNTFGFDNRNSGGALDLSGVTDLNTFLDPSIIPPPAFGGLSLYGQVGNDFAAFVNMLETNTKFTSLARPTIFTTNNKIARISSGRRVAVPTSSFSGVGSNVSTNVEFRDVVLELEILPLINDRNEVTLEISLVRDGLSENTRTIGDLGNIPDITTEELNTIVTVPNQSTIVLGGLITETDSETNNGIPILSQIPLVGGLFGSQSDGVTRNELVILIHPTIINDNIDLDAFQRLSDQDSAVAGRARDSVSGAVLPERGLIPDPKDKGAPPSSSTRPVGMPQAEAPAPTSKPRFGVRNGRRP